ncbi:hypothetical protein HDV03_000246 [Kappamyces sp. JEL0829]|nr:hypothetical protein HDV03_000246 [Kappamyces sp. JEL0829]
MSTKRKRPVLVAIPGASGTIAKGMKAVLAKVGSECVMLTAKWNTAKAASQSNLDQVLAVLPASGPVVLLASSFGCRVVCELLSKGLVSPDKVIFCGFPLYGPKQNSERVDQLQQLASLSVPLRFISGSLDEFLHRPYLDKKGMEALSDILEPFDAALVSIKVIENGSHSVPDAKGKQSHKALQSQKALEWIEECL